MRFKDRAGVLIQKYFCMVYDYLGNTNLSKGYWNPKRKLGITIHFSEILDSFLTNSSSLCVGGMKIIYRAQQKKNVEREGGRQPHMSLSRTRGSHALYLSCACYAG